MFELLLMVSDITKKFVFKLCDLNINSTNNDAPNDENSIIRRCLSDVADRTYCASSIEIHTIQNTTIID